MLATPSSAIEQRDHDWICLAGLGFYARHGLLAGERAGAQLFVVDLAVAVDARAAGETDDLAQTVDYAALYSEARGIVQDGPPRALLEALAESLARRILERFPVAAVRVRVEKPHAPLAPGIQGRASVEITRIR